MTDAPILMKDGYARPTRQDVTGWLMRGEVLMAVGVIGVIMLLIVPVPKLLLDLLLAISIVSSVLILMTAVMMKRPLDFAIDGEGAFFTVGDGANGEAYTRDGAFTLDPEGRLTTKAGAPVLGDGGEIVLNPALGPVSVGADGTITQDGQTTGRLSVVRFEALGVLEKGGDGLYRNTSNAQTMDAPDARIQQGMLEAANVNPLIEITNLVEISRAYESVTRMIENATDLSRRAVERLGRAA